MAIGLEYDCWLKMKTGKSVQARASDVVDGARRTSVA